MTEDSRLPYDVFVDWDARLSREMPFFESLFEQVGVRRVLDVGCGSGMHAVSFAKSGLEVVGVDPSEGMLESARTNADAAGVDVRFERGVFDDATRFASAPFDAVIALGNGLPHVDGRNGLRSAIESLASALRDGGVLVLHLLNHQRLADANVRMLPPKHRSTPEGDVVFVRVIDHVKGGFVFSFITLERAIVGQREGLPFPDDIEAAPWELYEHRSLHSAMPPALLASELERAGLGEIEMFGDHTGRLLDPERDESVIVVARKSG